MGERTPVDLERQPAIGVAGAAKDRSAAVLPGELQLPATARAALAEVAPVRLRVAPGPGTGPAVQPVRRRHGRGNHSADPDRGRDQDAHGATLPPPGSLTTIPAFVMTDRSR